MRLTHSYDANRNKFTGKERDSESGLDNFGARYDSSSLGRFMSPDWSASPEPVPYGDLRNPQSLNLYTYVKDNPLSATDPDGHCTNNGEQKGFWWCFFHYSDQDKLHDASNFFSNNDVYINGRRINPSKMTDAELLKAWQDFNNEWRAAIAAGANPLGGIAMSSLIIGTDKLAHIYDKHAQDFGLTGPKNKEQLSALGEALEQHVADPDTALVKGKYRGEDANIYVNSRTNNAVVTDRSNNVIAGFKLSPQQMNYVRTSGTLN
jgi:RHS repeat-associated protein